MLDYQNILQDPFPENRDPVTGEWLPTSHADMKAAKAAQERAELRQADANLTAEIAHSMFK